MLGSSYFQIEIPQVQGEALDFAFLTRDAEADALQKTFQQQTTRKLAWNRIRFERRLKNRKSEDNHGCVQPLELARH